MLHKVQGVGEIENSTNRQQKIRGDCVEICWQ